MAKGAFDKRAFLKASFVPRTAEVRVEALSFFFPDGAEPIFTVRGLTGTEMAQSLDAAAKNKTLDIAAKALATTNEQIAHVREALGVADDLPTEWAKRIEQLIVGGLDPVFDRELALKFLERYPAEFYIVTTKIMELTGLGMDIKKSSASGKTKASETT